MWTRFSLAALTVLPLCAQTNTGTITGLVTDPAGAALAGAKVIMRNQATGATAALARWRLIGNPTWRVWG